MGSTATTLVDARQQVLIDCQVHIPEFEGPLDLLLHLIKNHELDILNLPISKITKQYLSYLDYMRELNLDLASEYLVMAATLTFLKSQMILPQEKTEEDTGNDPRSKLIRQLIELKNYKELSRDLAARPRLYRDSFPCGNNGSEELSDSFEPTVALSNPYQMIDAYKDLLERRKKIVHNVVKDQVPVPDCMDRVAQALLQHDEVSFQSILPQLHKAPELISSFLAILEMSKMQLTGIRQDEIFGPITIFRRTEKERLLSFKEHVHSMSWE